MGGRHSRRSSPPPPPPPPPPPSPFVSYTYTVNVINVGTTIQQYDNLITEYNYNYVYNDGWYKIPDNVVPKQPLSSTVLSNNLAYRLMNSNKTLYLYKDDGTVFLEKNPVITQEGIFRYIKFPNTEIKPTYLQVRNDPLPTNSHIRIITKKNNLIQENIYSYAGNVPISLGPFNNGDTIVIYFFQNTNKYLPYLFNDNNAYSLSDVMNLQTQLNYTNMNAYKYTFTKTTNTFYLVPMSSLPLKYWSYRSNLNSSRNVDLANNEDCNPLPKFDGYSLLPTTKDDYNSFTGMGVYVNLFTDFECKVKANETIQSSSNNGYNTNLIPYNEHSNANYYKLSSQPVIINQPQMFNSMDANGDRQYINPDDPGLCRKLPYESTNTNSTSVKNNGYDITYYTDDQCMNQYIDAQYNINPNNINNTDYTTTNINGKVMENSNAIYYRVYKQP